MRAALRTGVAALACAPLALAVLACAGTRPPATAEAPTSADSVSVGYGRQTRSANTNAVSSLSTEEIGDASILNVVELIRGRMPGVQVVQRSGGELSLRVRGATTAGFQTADALLVIDGTQIIAGSQASVLAGMNPHDVARIEVLKDAGATAIYGLRGASGVVVITTKQGPR